jgi:two-component system sensor histidine kinase BaeS
MNVRGPRLVNSLSARTVGLSVLVAVVAVAVALAVSFPLISAGARAQAQADLDRLAEVAVAAVQGPADSATISRLRSEFRSSGVTAYLIGPGLAPVPGLDPAISADVLGGGSVSGATTVAGAPSLVAGRPLGRGFGLVLVTSSAAADNVAGETLRRLLLALLAGLSAAVLIGLLASRRVTRPLRRAADAAERMTAGERGLRLDASGPTEVGDIAEALNRLGDSLAASEGRQRDFLLSVSHELRTPLTAIRGYAEALSDGLVDDVPATGEVLADEARRMDRLVADLLDLARLGAVDVAVDSAQIDLVAVASRAAQVWRDRCAAAGVDFAAELPEGPVAVHADTVRVRQIIDNLAENALRVTPAGRPIVLSVATHGSGGSVEVRDGGPGLSEDDRRVAFEPAALYSRYRGVRSVGTGIGLALVARLAARMGGSAHVSAAAEGGAAFSVVLPPPLPGVDGGSPPAG